MARPKSEDKRNAILAAAMEIFAERGLGAATVAVSSAAEVAEGTLFTYFSTKDELLNALYRQIKMELADAMMLEFPRKKSVRQRLQHIWDCYVNWGVANPSARKALALLEVSGKLTQESKAAGSAPFTEIQTMAQDAIEQRIFQDLPLEFIAGATQALAQMTMEFMAQRQKTADMYRTAGFEMLWAGITKNS
jgi:AcrR family transcriptional regulator